MKRTEKNICPACDAGDPTSLIVECECAELEALNTQLSINLEREE